MERQFGGMRTDSQQQPIARVGGDLTVEERARVFASIVQFFVEESDVDANQITRDSDLEADLGADSLTYLELFEEMRAQYGLDVEIDAVMRHARHHSTRTVGELVEQICLFLEHKIDLDAEETAERE